jgi:hypothetical protein
MNILKSLMSTKNMYFNCLSTSINPNVMNTKNLKQKNTSNQ